MPKRKREISPKEDAESFGFIGGCIGFFLAYLSAEAALAARPHPVHWLVALVGALLIGVGAYGIVFWRRTHLR